MLFRCRSCQGPFRPSRSDALTCSGRCRKARARLKRDGPRSEFLAREHGIEARDQWRTNPHDFAPLAHEFGYTLDAAALSHDALCPEYITPIQNGLETSWLERAGVALPGYPRPFVWCNPPYSRLAGGLLVWVEKAVYEASVGVPSTLLVPPSQGARYMQLAHRWAAEVRWYASRRTFLHPDTGLPAPGNRGDSCVIVVTPERLLRTAARAAYSYVDGVAPFDLSRR